MSQAGSRRYRPHPARGPVDRPRRAGAGRGRRPDERGAILILSAVSVVVAVIAASFAVDLGFISQTARRTQLVADMAALDASRVLPLDPTGAAQASAVRNDFPYDQPGYALVVEWAPTPAGPFNSDPSWLPAATAVRVTATSPHQDAFPFVEGPDDVSRSAVGVVRPTAGFTIGSSLATLDSSSSALLNPLLTQAVGGFVNLSLVSWQGLAGGSVGVSALQSQLAAMGFSVGTVDQMLGAQMTLAQLYQATASALTLGGDTANASVMDALRVAATSSAQITLGGMLEVAQGHDTAVLAGSLNLFQLVTGSALLANGTNTLTIPNAGITVPGVTSTSLSLKVTEVPQTYIGPVGGSVSTGQVELVVTPQLNLNVTAGLSLLRVTGALPVRLDLGGATGTLTDASCSGITVNADPEAFSGTAQASDLNVATLAGVNLLTVRVSSLTPSVDGPATDLTFAYPAEFAPPAGSKHAGSQPVGLESLTSFTPVQVTVTNALTLGLLGLTSNAVVSAVIASLPPLIGDVDEEVLTPLLTSLGLEVGGADVTALRDHLRCQDPALAA